MKRSLRNKAGREDYIENEHYVDLVRQETSPEERDNKIASHVTMVRRVKRAHSKGQALLVIALMMTVLVIFVGLGVDVGNLMGMRAKLQSAVDASALSAADLLLQSNASQAATDKAYQMLQTNGVPTSTLNLAQTSVTFPGPQQVTVHAVQHANTFFMRIIPMWSVVDIEAEATADINSYAEISAKPYGQIGVVNELNMSVWGVNSWRGGGDAYSPRYIDNTNLNPQYDMLPYGYLYRIDVPPSYSYSHISVQIFDPDSFNRPGTPPVPPTPTCGPTPCTPSPTPTWTADQYAYCASYDVHTCSTAGQQYDPGLKINAYPDSRPAFWRVDEIRTPHDVGSGIASVYNTAYFTQVKYTLWHFNPRITSAFDNPVKLSDQNVVGGSGTYLARYDNSIHQDNFTDLRWYQPSGFDVQLTGCGGGDCFTREANGGFYFYLYIQGYGGSSENNFDLRTGPPHSQLAVNPACADSDLGGAYSTDCYVNKLYYDNSKGTIGDWDAKGTSIFAKRALPLNLDTGNHFPMLFVQVPKTAAGQTLGVRHFDQDCHGFSGNGTCGRNADHKLTYQMQKCGADPNLDTSFIGIGTGGYVGDTDSWVADSTYDDPEDVPIPQEGSTDYNTVFGACSSSWMRLQSDPSDSNDTTVWEMPFVRPRLIK